MSTAADFYWSPYYRSPTDLGIYSAARYGSPWTTLFESSKPLQLSEIFRRAAFEIVGNPIISPIIRKMASYPITDIVLDEKQDPGFDQFTKRWEELLFKVLKLPKFQVEIGIDYWGYGNGLLSIGFPFNKVLICPSCKETINAVEETFDKVWKFRDFHYYINCKCGYIDRAEVKDIYLKAYKRIRLIRWCPSDIITDHNPINNTTEYYYRISPHLRSAVLNGNPRYIVELPQKFIDAIKHDRRVKLRRENLYHFRLPSPSLPGGGSGMAYPLCYPGLNPVQHYQLMNKAHEAILMEHLLPFDIFYPTASDASASPYQVVSLRKWKQELETALQRRKRDPNYKPVMDFPVGWQRIGGTGRQLLPLPEMRSLAETIIGSCGVPTEFYFGGLSWSGSSVSLRMLENFFTGYRVEHQHMIADFIVPLIARFMGWTPVRMHMRQFKMADDIQLKQLLMSLRQMKDLSRRTLLTEFEKNADAEREIISREDNENLLLQRKQQLAMAQMQAEAMKIQAKAQQELQQTMAPQGAPPAQAQQAQEQQQFVSPEEEAAGYAQQLKRMNPEQANSALEELQAKNPDLAAKVMQLMKRRKAPEQEALPERLPPRRHLKVV